MAGSNTILAIYHASIVLLTLTFFLSQYKIHAKPFIRLINCLCSIYIANELIAFFGSPRGSKHNMNFSSPQGVYVPEKYNGLSESVAFAKN